MTRPRTFALLLGAAAAAGTAAAVIRHRGSGAGIDAPGGILIADTSGYDRSTGLLLGSFYGSVAADVARVVPPDARVLEVGCGPGHLSVRLARDDGFQVTGLDLDPAMIERANANADRAARPGQPRPSFVVGDAGSLPFPDESFDVVVSTMSMHHWADPAAGLAEIGRVLRCDGRALVWDLRRGGLPFNRDVPDPAEHAHGSGLRLVSTKPWRWPWRFTFAQRLELAPPAGSGGQAATAAP